MSEYLAVNTPMGIVKGRKCAKPKVENAKQVYRFAKIPFAKPPVGELRFEPPQKFVFIYTFFYNFKCLNQVRVIFLLTFSLITLVSKKLTLIKNGLKKVIFKEYAFFFIKYNKQDISMYIGT